MSNKRKSYSEAQNILLLSQVNRVCPLCAEPLFYSKKGRAYKSYEIAHIYPLNPTSDEIILLKNEERLNADVNHEDNVIPLCKVCHGKFDRPRTIEEYQRIFSIKKTLIDQSAQETIWKTYAIEEDISRVIEAIYHNPDIENKSEIEFIPKEVDDKLDETVTKPTKKKIKNNVRDYYIFISKKLAELDNIESDLSETISLQIKTFYLKQKGMGLDQQTIFENIIAWLYTKTKPKTNDAAEILASFFIQNCEVF